MMNLLKNKKPTLIILKEQSKFHEDGTFENWYNEMGYIRSKCDPCFLYKQNKKVSVSELRGVWLNNK